MADGWRRVRLPWAVAAPAVFGMDRQLMGVDLPWSKVAIENSTTLACHRETFDAVTVTRHVGEEDGAKVDWIRVHLRVRETGAMLDLVWARGEPDGGQAAARIPSAIAIDPGSPPPPADNMEERMRWMTAVLQHKYGPNVVEFLHYTIEDVAAIDMDACGECTSDPKTCDGISCTFLRHIGADPVTGVQLGRAGPGEFEAEGLDHTIIRQITDLGPFEVPEG